MLRHPGRYVPSRINRSGFDSRTCREALPEGVPVMSTAKEIRMKVKYWVASALALACTMAASGVAATLDDKPTDGSKGSAFKSAVFEMKQKAEVAVLLTCVAGREVIVTTNGDKETDVNLFIHDADKNEVGKDTSPGPKCEVKFTPKTEGTYKLLVKNKGPGPNNVTLAVKVAE